MIASIFLSIWIALWLVGLVLLENIKVSTSIHQKVWFIWFSGVCIGAGFGMWFGAIYQATCCGGH